MVTAAHPRLALVFCLTLALFTCAAFAQEGPPPSPIPLEKIPEQIAAQEDQWQKSIAEVRETIRTEIAAKRLDPAAAQGLLSSLRGDNARSGVEVRQIVDSVDLLPAPNEPIKAAVKKLETLWKTILADRTALSRNLETSARQRIIQLLETAEKPADVDPLLVALQAARTVQQTSARTSRTSLPYVGWDVRVINSTNYYIQFLSTLRGALAARANGEPKLLGLAIVHLKEPMMNLYGLASGDVQPGLTRLVKPFVDALQAAQIALDQALIARRPARELATLLARYEDASSNAQSAQPNDGSPGYRELSAPLNAYRALVNLSRALENADISSLRGELATVRRESAVLGAERVNALDPLLLDAQKRCDATSGRMTGERKAAWHERLAAVKTPGDLREVALEMQRTESDSANPRSPENPPGFGADRHASTDLNLDLPRGLGDQLAALAAAWSNSNPRALAPANDGYAKTGEYGKDLSELHLRISRELVSRSLAAQELLQPPLAGQPLNDALEALAQKLDHTREWYRLLLLLRDRASINGYPITTSPWTDTTEAIRSYLAGKNLELAGQWAEAASAYKAVLTSAAELGPIKEAAERLQAISKEHASELPPSSAPSPKPAAAQP